MRSLIVLRERTVYSEHVGPQSITETSPGEGSEQITSRHRAIPAGYQDGQWKERLLVSPVKPGDTDPLSFTFSL